ncbi:helix-turn-helix domain-containing protein, partial [Rhizobium leguminosarum]|uniref:helix-turn-helix domain-containing protein n=1 Tax=Rhizobium leguminosarum TaxID=384 RepID=UPI003F9C5CE5
HYAERVVLGVEGGGTAAVAPPPTDATLPERLERYEAEIIRDALSANDGDVRRTIEALGIPRNTFYDKLQRHGINRGGYISRK